MKCSKCGEKIKKRYKVCPICGESIQIPEQKPLFLKYSKIIVGLLIIVLLVLCLWLVVPYILEPNIEELKKSVVQICVYDWNDELLATGSGVVAFEDDVVITNAHVIENNYKLEVISENNTKYQVEGIIGYNKKKDIAILKLSDSKNLKALDIKNTLSVGDDVTAIGSPLGIKNTVSNGIFSGYFLDKIEVYQHTAPISSGSSGGALFDARGRLVGITYASIEEGQNINFAIPIKEFKNEYEIVKGNKCLETENYKFLNNGILKTKEGSQLISYALNDEYDDYEIAEPIWQPVEKAWCYGGTLEYTALSNENWWFGKEYNKIQKYVASSLYITSGDHVDNREEVEGIVQETEQDYYTVAIVKLKDFSDEALKEMDRYFEENLIQENGDKELRYDIYHTKNYAYCLLYKNYDNINKVKEIMNEFP